MLQGMKGKAGYTSERIQNYIAFFEPTTLKGVLVDAL